MKRARVCGAALALLFVLLAAPAMAQTTVDGQNSVGKVIIIPAGTTVNGDVTAWGADVRVLGTVTGRVTAVGGQVVVADSGKVENNVTAIGGDITLGDTASVGHDALALGGNVNTGNNANVGGSVAASGSGLVEWSRDYFGLRFQEPADRVRDLGRTLINSYSWVALVFIFGVALLYFAPRALDNTSITLNYAPGIATLIGLLTALIIPVGLGAIAVLLILSVVGIAALPLLIVVAALAAAYSLVVTGLWLGERITALLGQPNYSDTRRQIIPLAAGLIIITTVSVLLNLALPPLGGLFNILALSFGLGAAVLSRFGQHRPSAAPLPIV
jgi:hypothetical protein